VLTLHDVGRIKTSKLLHEWSELTGVCVEITLLRFKESNASAMFILDESRARPDIKESVDVIRLTLDAVRLAIATCDNHE
jgi:hypothetical protein